MSIVQKLAESLAQIHGPSVVNLGPEDAAERIIELESERSGLHILPEPADLSCGDYNDLLDTIAMMLDK